MREKDLPVEVIEHKEIVTQFAWEPSGNRFGIITTSDPNYGQAIPGVVIKYSVDFYQLDTKKGDFALIRHLENKAANVISWSPKGRHVILGTIGSATKCDLEFWDLDFTTDDNPNKKEVEPGSLVTMMGVGEHYAITEMAWDPSGRYLASWASSFRQTVRRTYCLLQAIS